MVTSWKRIATLPIYRSGFISLYKDDVVIPGASNIDFIRVEMPDFAVALPIDQEGRIVMIRNYRYPADREFLELPSGHVDKRESALDCARRELAEETGYTAGRLVKLGWYSPLPRSRQRATLFLATGLKKGEPLRDATEQQTVVHIPIKKAIKMMLDGKFKHAPTIIALALGMPLLSCD